MSYTRLFRYSTDKTLSIITVNIIILTMISYYFDSDPDKLFNLTK